MKLTSARTLILSTLLGIVALPACGSTLSLSPPSTSATPTLARIAFDTVPRKYGSGASAIYLINVDGSGLMQLATHATNPVWSPDGQQIAFEGRGIDVMNADGSHKMTLTSSDHGHYSPPTWSPDGKRIAFEYHNNDYGRIYRINADGSGLEAITEGADERTPNWSPDGQWIAFLYLKEHHTDFKIAILNTKTEDWQLLLNDQPGEAVLVWSPDGRKLAFISGDGQIHVIDIGENFQSVDSSETTTITSKDIFSAWFSMAWSPDGRQIAFVSKLEGNEEIYVVNSDGSDKQRLTSNAAQDFNPAWSPDGQQIAFVSKRDGNQEIYVMNADGSNQTRLTNTPEDEWGPVWQPQPNH